MIHYGYSVQVTNPKQSQPPRGVVFWVQLQFTLVMLLKPRTRQRFLAPLIEDSHAEDRVFDHAVAVMMSPRCANRFAEKRFPVHRPPVSNRSHLCSRSSCADTALEKHNQEASRMRADLVLSILRSLCTECPLTRFVLLKLFALGLFASPRELINQKSIIFFRGHGYLRSYPINIDTTAGRG
jgi:hypothetical protein